MHILYIKRINNEVVLNILVLNKSCSQRNYGELQVISENLTLESVDLEWVLRKAFSYDAIVVDETYLKEIKDLKRFKQITYVTDVYFVLEEESKVDLAELFRLGAKDIFCAPINLKEISLKIKTLSNLENSSILNMVSYGITLKQMQVYEMLRLFGPKGVCRETFLKKIWNSVNVDPKNVDVQIYGLRKVLKENNIGDIKCLKRRWYLIPNLENKERATSSVSA